jgi:hypothetical protein
MSVASIQAVISAWKTLGRNGLWKSGWQSNCEDAERGLGRNQVKAQPHIASEEQNLFAYADEQIRALIQHTFLSGSLKPLRQIIFAGADESAPVSDLCMRIATVLAEGVRSDVCLVGNHNPARIDHKEDAQFQAFGFPRPSGQISSNLWLIPASALWDSGPGTSANFCRQLEGLNRDFEFSVIEGPSVRTHPGALMLAKCCDGVVLALEAELTRRAAAQKAKETLASAGANLLGTILCNRSFPIPDAIYRRV